MILVWASHHYIAEAWADEQKLTVKKDWRLITSSDSLRGLDRPTVVVLNQYAVPNELTDQLLASRGVVLHWPIQV